MFVQHLFLISVFTFVAHGIHLNDEKAIELIKKHPTLMKRPVFLVGDEVLFGFDKAIQAELARRFG